MEFRIRRDVIEAQKTTRGRVPGKKIAKSDFERILEKECEKLSGHPINLTHIEEVRK